MRATARATGKWAVTITQVLIWLICLRFLRGWYRRGQAPSEQFLFAWLGAALSAVMCGVLSMAGLWWFVPVTLLFVVVAMPWTIARLVFIPLGMSRTARYLSSLSGFAWGTDRHGGGLIAGAWAILRQKQPDRAAIAALEKGRENATRLTAAQVVAAGLIAEARDDHSSARRLLESALEIGPKTTPASVHALAREWLAADAASTGKWSRVAELASAPDGRGRSTRVTRLLGATARRLIRQPGAPGDVTLWLRWLIAPRRRATLALVRRAVATGRTTSSGISRQPLRLATSIQPDIYADALGSHVAVLNKCSHRGAAALVASDLSSLAETWDRALVDPATRAMIMQRAAVLGARSGERAFAGLSESVADELTGLARSARLALADWRPEQLSSSVLADAQRQLKNQLIGEIELGFDGLQGRVSDRRAMSAMDEWREWVSLRALYQRGAALGGIELRRLAFPHVHHSVCRLAVWLWNERSEHLMANAMFRWLLSEAMAVGDSEAIELQSRNWDKEL